MCLFSGLDSIDIVSFHVLRLLVFYFDCALSDLPAGIKYEFKREKDSAI